MKENNLNHVEEAYQWEVIEDAFALRRLTHHEVVTKQFCDLQLEGRSDISIQSILEFFENPPTQE